MFFLCKYVPGLCFGELGVFPPDLEQTFIFQVSVYVCTSALFLPASVPSCLCPFLLLFSSLSAFEDSAAECNFIRGDFFYYPAAALFILSRFQYLEASGSYEGGGG